MLEQTQNSSPELPTIVNGRDLNNTGDKWKNVEQSSFMAAADAQNQLNMAKYNNDYNYWLWQQQTAYNSPEQQVERLKRAGLNPNFNSIEGAGNASSPSASQGSLKTNFLGAYQANIAAREMKIQQANSIVNGLNSLVKNIGEGFQIADQYANLPASIPEYRNLMMDTLRNTVELGKRNITRADKSIENLVNQTAINAQKLRILQYQTGSSSDMIFSPYARNFTANTQKLLAQRGLINRQGDFVSVQAKKVASDIVVNGFKNALLNAQKGYYNSATAINRVREANLGYEGRSLLPLRVRQASQLYDLQSEQLKRLMYDNSLMKFDKWFGYSMDLLGGLTGAARAASPYLTPLIY